jgi:hypothetical protein
MAKRKFSPTEIRKITGASRSERIPIPFYYAPPFLDELRVWVEGRLSSRGGRPTIHGFDVVRKVRFTKKNWSKLESLAKNWSENGKSVSPAQVATSILDKAISSLLRP